MAISITSTFNSGGIAFTGGVATQSLTFTAGATMLAVAVMGDNGDDPLTITYNLASFTNAVSNPQGSVIGNSIWYLLAPATGSAHNLVITFAGNRSGGFTCWELTGTATSSPIGATGGTVNAGSTTSISAAITSMRANSLLLNAGAGGNPGTVMSTSNGETRDMNANGNGSIRVTTAHLALTTATSYTSGYTYSAMSNTALSIMEVMTPPPAPTSFATKFLLMGTGKA